MEYDNPNDIGKVIKAILTGSPEVMSMTRGRIYPIVSLSSDSPCVVYTKTGLVPAGVKEYPSYCLASVTVTVVAQSYNEMVSLSGAVLDALAEFSGTIEDKEIKRIAWRNARDGYEEGAYMQDMDFEIKMRQI